MEIRFFQVIAACLLIVLTVSPLVLLQWPLKGFACAQGLLVTLSVFAQPDALAVQQMSLWCLTPVGGYGLFMITKKVLGWQ